MEVSIKHAKTNFASLVEKAALGEEVIITKAGRPVAKLVSAGSATQPRKLGSAKGEFIVPKNFNEPLPEDIVGSFWK